MVLSDNDIKSDYIDKEIKIGSYTVSLGISKI